MLSQFFILSTRGDTIIKRDCNELKRPNSVLVRNELSKTTSETFFRKVKFWPGDPPPAFVSVDFADQEILSMSMVSTIFSLKSSAYTSLQPQNTTCLRQSYTT